MPWLHGSELSFGGNQLAVSPRSGSSHAASVELTYNSLEAQQASYHGVFIMLFLLFYIL